MVFVDFFMEIHLDFLNIENFLKIGLIFLEFGI